MSNKLLPPSGPGRPKDPAKRQAILEALQKAEGNRTAAARLLGVTFRSMRYRLERLGIE